MATKRSARFIICILMLNLLATSAQTPARAAVKAGTKCTKLNAVSAQFMCVKRNGKLIWVLTPKKLDQIQVTYPENLYVEDGNIPLIYNSLSGLTVEPTSESPVVCSTSGSMVIPVSHGQCNLLLKTQGNSKFEGSSRRENLIIKRRNQLTFQLQPQYLLSARITELPQLSSAGLMIDYLSETLTICVVRGSTVEFKSAGSCSIAASQAGDQFTDPIAKTNISLKIMQESKITFNPPTELALRLKTYSLDSLSSAGLPVSYKSANEDICTASAQTLTLKKIGTCTVIASQAEGGYNLAAPDESRSITISGQRVTADQPDSLKGYQIKAIYVVPSDGVDHAYDTNGFLTEVLNEGNSILKLGIGYEYQIDSIGNDYDIQFLKSTYPTSYFLNAERANDDLMKELKIADSYGLNRKNYIFFIDVPSFNRDTACGYANIPGMSAVVAVSAAPGNTGPTCVGKSLQLKNYISHTWVHESVHNLGVEHTKDDPCDLMRGSSTQYCNTVWTVDSNRSRYVGANQQGVNILSLRVWKGETANNSLRALCQLPYSMVPRSDGVRYALCPTGTQVIGALTYCWSQIRSAELQVWRDNGWVSLGQGKTYNEPWGTYVNWKCNSGYVAPWMELTVTTPGPQKYRWMINGSESEQFLVNWQN